jgi:hypothetical protein
VHAKPSGRVTVIVYSSPSSGTSSRAFPGSSRKILRIVVEALRRKLARRLVVIERALDET